MSDFAHAKDPPKAGNRIAGGISGFFIDCQHSMMHKSPVFLWFQINTNQIDLINSNQINLINSNQINQYKSDQSIYINYNKFEYNLLHFIPDHPVTLRPL